ncbi:MAG TPA: stage III sporulation protein AB [Defluviitaleaceae bacterium]|jgi:stage III sporulation protein AB|nr:stage III sporulation protein AB [Defluviitaleaceae bacterium]HPT77282.1 stage III sporulation protein AB [Defluviitaleaceae bacterium]HQD50023.1 stage III sporulation protein AB [Defluviitaleaceae bacterium]
MTGALMIITGTAFIGYLFDRFELYRMKDLENIKRALLFLKGEIDYMIASLPVAMEEVGSRVGTNIGKIFSHVGESMKNKRGYSAEKLWKESVELYKDSTYLSKEDINNLLALGTALGYLDKEMQKNNIDLLLVYLEDEINRLKLHRHKNGRLYKTLGFLGGILIVILLY